ncbi:MAG: CPBP family intramembrane metalloprotease [Alphaproteobacteria bacterium]|nr:CPBP family intramembrane metalloprotease [Alphaproteobacteria bacterium]
MTSEPTLKRLPLFLAVFFAAWTIRILLIPWTDAAAETVDAARMIADGWRLLLWLVLPIAWCVAVEKIDPRGAADQRPGTRPWLGWVFAVAYLIASRAAGMAVGEHWHLIPADLPPMAFYVSLVGLAFVALVEVYVFYGLVLKALRARFAFWPANLIASALFAAINLPGWIALIELDAQTLTLLLAQVFVFGVLLGFTVRTTGFVLAAMLLHLANNALQGLGFPG